MPMVPPPDAKEPEPERRSQVQIYADILRLLQRKGGAAKPTHILYGANLSHKRLLKYLEVLLIQGFIEQASMGGRMVYRITPKGHVFLKELKKIEQFSEAFGVPI